MKEGDKTMLKRRNSEATVLEEPPLAMFLFGDTRMAWLWLPLRLYLEWGMARGWAA
jgi:hypothetical protein